VTAGDVSVVVEDATRLGDVLTTIVRVVDDGRKTYDLDGPSTLVFAETGRLLQVHRGRALGDGKVGLLSFGDDEAPRVGESADLTVWWIPGAWPMLRDATGWRQAVISEDDVGPDPARASATTCCACEPSPGDR
jgi:hypothetical protein